MTQKCPRCDKEIGRRRGNLHSFLSLRRAVESLLERHIAKHHRFSDMTPLQRMIVLSVKEK